VLFDRNIRGSDVVAKLILAGKKLEKPIEIGIPGMEGAGDFIFI
jgi:hypothetical protein